MMRGERAAIEEGRGRTLRGQEGEGKGERKRGEPRKQEVCCVGEEEAVCAAEQAKSME